jgi:hypothetical protein
VYKEIAMAILNLEGFSGVALSIWRRANPGRKAPKNGDIVSLQFKTWDEPREYRAQWFGTPEKGMRLYWHRCQTAAQPAPAHAQAEA